MISFTRLKAGFSHYKDKAAFGRPLVEKREHLSGGASNARLPLTNRRLAYGGRWRRFLPLGGTCF